MPNHAIDGRQPSKTLSQLAYDSLRTMILSGEVRPGERLGERELARRIRVSRTPLREALGRLERDGLAVSKPGLGYFALEFDPEVVEKLYEFREILEIQACRLAAARIGSGGLRELADIMKQLSAFERKRKLTVDEIRAEVHLGLRIHEIIARESGNNFIHEALLQLYDRLRLLTWIDVLWYDKWPLTRKEHRDLVAAITAKDGERAAKAIQRHMRRCKEDALWVIKAQHREVSHVAPSREDRRRR
ncbi:MAG TPA: GntR family transcriptional regulator [Alphaproteobacteria bacterium]|nr:GntR family transcriptional regulator [Alphaproteobacteria bacterium]